MRKRIVYVIEGKYPGCSYDEVDEFDTREEAEEMLKEYRMAFGKDYILYIREREEE